jgi:hypothetical protein
MEEKKMTVIPDGVDAETARIAIAWEIANRTVQIKRSELGSDSDNEYIDLITQAFRRAYEQLSKGPKET